MATTTSRAVSAATWLRPPLETITAVRLPLLLTGKPCSSPADTLAAPRASSSWLALIGGSSRVANARPVSTLSVKPTAAIPVAASATWTRSSAAKSGTFGTGSPRGTSPTTARPQPVGADDRHHDRGGDHDDQHPRPAWPERPPGQQQDHHDAAQDQGGVVDQSEVGGDVGDLGEGAARRHLHTR